MLSITITLYVPANKLSRSSVSSLSPTPSLSQSNVNGLVPPKILISIVPEESSKQSKSSEIPEMVNTPGSRTSTDKAAIQPVERSLIMTEYVPADKLDKSSVSSLSPTPSLSQSMVYELDPLIVKSIEPLELPLQSTSVTTALKVGAFTFVIDNTSLLEQLLSSVTVI